MELDPEATSANRGLLVFEDVEKLNEEAKKVVQEYDRKWHQRFKVYTEWHNHPSDRWVYMWTNVVESVFSVATGNYFFIIATSSFLVIIVNILWSLVFSITKVKESFSVVDYSVLFGLLTFVSSFFYYDIFNYNKETSFNTLRLYHRATHYVRWINDGYEIAFDYLMKEYHFNKSCRSAKIGKMTKNDLVRWYNRNIKKVERMFVYLIILNIYSLRVFIRTDFHNDYEDFGVSRYDLIKVLLEFQKNKKIQYHYNPDQILLHVVKEIEKIVHFFPIVSTIEGTHRFTLVPQSNILNQINLLKQNLLDSSTARHVPTPNFYIITRNGFVFFWIYVLIPFIAYQAASTLLFLFGSIVMIALQIPLINVWFISKPFIYISHYAGPNYFKWRKQNFREINNTFTKISDQLQKLKKCINGIPT